MKSMVDMMLEKASAKEPDVLLSPEEEKEFVPIEVLKKELADEFPDEDEQELPAEEDGVELADPILATLNVLSIVATKAYPYGGFINDEDADEIKKEWGGEDIPNPYSVQDDDI